MKKKEKRMLVYVDVGSHGGVFEFWAGFIAEKYPGLLHVYRKKLCKEWKQATLIYKY
jgi:hypothetical protein